MNIQLCDRVYFWNLSQTLAEAVGLIPIDCHFRRKRTTFCKGCEPGDLYECGQCKRLTSFCNGSDDNDFEICDNCWKSKHREDFE
jgi:hypothetical protein